MLNSLLTVAFLSQCLRISVPYAFPALGATFSERGGVVNIALEGILLISAFAATVGTYFTGSPLFGVVCGIAAGGLTAFLHGLITITLKADQIVSGIGINLLAVGLTKFCCQLIFNSSSNSDRIAGIDQWSFFGSIPILDNPFVILIFILAIVMQFVLFKTRFGLRLRSVGEFPAAAESLGVNISRMRHAGVVISGVMTGIGGAWLAFNQHSFTDGMSAGRGFIALAAMIIGKWNPLGALAACLLFGIAESLSIQLQSTSQYIQFIQLIPYVVTMIVLAGFIGRAVPPAADGIPYEKDAA
ncbi:MAG TPA: ABC transporter permease [Bacteroidota bacterium]|nr:ABC transporter permease [Bacteroidota bacterium]